MKTSDMRTRWNDKLYSNFDFVWVLSKIDREVKISRWLIAAPVVSLRAILYTWRTIENVEWRLEVFVVEPLGDCASRYSKIAVEHSRGERWGLVFFAFTFYINTDRRRWISSFSCFVCFAAAVTVRYKSYSQALSPCHSTIVSEKRNSFG